MTADEPRTHWAGVVIPDPDAGCRETRTIGTPPLTVTLGCKRKARHTGKHLTPDGSAEWWGPTDRQIQERADV